MSPFAWVSDKIENVFIVAFNFCSQHPVFSGIVGSWLGFCFLVTCTIKGLYPSSKWKRDDRPACARVLLLICNPFIGNFEAIIEYFLGKVGIKLPVPFVSDESSQIPVVESK